MTLAIRRLAGKLAAIALTLAVGCSTTKTDSAPIKLAIIIANDYSQDQKTGLELKTVRNDAIDLSEKFQSAGFTVRQVFLWEPGALDKINSELSTPADTKLVYLSGHGIQINGRNYFLLDGVGNMVRLDDIVARASGSSRAHYFVFDACRNNTEELEAAVEGAIKVKSLGDMKGLVREELPSWLSSTRPGLADMELPQNSLMIFSAAPGKPALAYLKPEDRRSPFANALMRADLGRQSIAELAGQIQREVSTDTSGFQLPHVSSVSVDFEKNIFGEDPRPTKVDMPLP